jgi:hypothetical protein
LLRYLSEATKALGQSVPVRFRTPELEELTFSLASVVRGVDASLLEEWQALRDPGAAAAAVSGEIDETETPAASPGGAPRRGPDLLGDPRALATRVRTDLHRLLAALARKDYEEATLALRVAPDTDEPGFTGDKLAAAMAPFYEDHSRILLTPASRHPSQTILRPRGDAFWEAEQRICDPEGHDDWAIHAEVDLSAGVPQDGPLIRLVRLGL